MKSVLIVLLTILLTSCGIIRNAEVRGMPEAQVAQIDDETLCQDARRMTVLGEQVPVTVIRELQKRNLMVCMEEKEK